MMLEAWRSPQTEEVPLAAHLRTTTLEFDLHYQGRHNAHSSDNNGSKISLYNLSKGTIVRARPLTGLRRFRPE